MEPAQKISLERDQSLAVAPPTPGGPGYVPPTAQVPLPSAGQVYPPDSAVGGAESVEIRSMTARDEDILTSVPLLRQGRAISTLLRSCLVSKAIDPEALIVGDRNAILVAIRITGYGSEYRIPVTCPSCDVTTKDHEFNLSKLEIRRLGQAPDAPGTNAFSFVLPSGRAVVFKLLTGSDERDLAAALERMKKLGTNEGAITQRLLASVVSLAGDSDRARLSGAIRDMPARDSRALRTRIEKVTPGIAMEQGFTCPSCGESSEVDVPMGPEFFWPSR